MAVNEDVEKLIVAGATLKQCVPPFTIKGHQHTVAELYELCNSLECISLWYFSVSTLNFLQEYKECVEHNEPLSVCRTKLVQAKLQIARNITYVLESLLADEA